MVPRLIIIEHIECSLLSLSSVGEEYINTEEMYDWEKT